LFEPSSKLLSSKLFESMISLICGKKLDFDVLRLAPAAFNESSEDSYSG
jgi:hypothetical protein